MKTIKKQIVILGDICPDNDYRKLFDEKGNTVFSDAVVHDIKKSALTIANLECPATDNIVPIAKCGPNLKAETRDVNKLKNIGIDVLSLANNHILDYGDVGVIDTLKACRECGMHVVGAGESSESAAQSVIYDLDDNKIGIMSFAEAEFNLASEKKPGANHFDPYISLDSITNLKRECDYAIVLYHGGIEHYIYPSPLLQKKCRKMVESGADLVLCQHSHCIGTMEEYKDSTIVYGQGNSVFGYRQGDDSWNEGFLVTVDLEEENEVEFKLLKATRAGVEYADERENDMRIQKMKKDSERINDFEWLKEQWKKFASTQKALDLPLLYGWNRAFNKLNRIMSNKLIDLIYSRRKKMITMNLLRCEAHHEVVKTILEDEIFKDN